MIHSIREKFNSNFTEKKYEDYIRRFEEITNCKSGFRIAETPIFIPKDFKINMLDTCEHIIDFILDKDFISQTNQSIPSKYHISNDENDCEMMVFDFGVCKDDQGNIVPQLIEMQGFPSLYGFQILNNSLTTDYASIPENFDSYLNGYNKETYVQLLKEIIIGENNPENVILLEAFPEKQKTFIDFKCTESILGIPTVCISSIIAENDSLYYNSNGSKIKIEKIFNRIIFDDLEQDQLKKYIDVNKKYQVEWIPHPNWFYRISKYTLPYLQHPFIPETFFLNELKQPLSLDEFVLKPLFSYAGMGVIIDVTQDSIDSISDPENWILQRKVEYASIIDTPDEPAKAEIRLFYFRKKGWPRPIAVHNLARLSKGKMIGTRYNQDQTWVGGTIAYFEK